MSGSSDAQALLGAIAMASLVAALFFFRFWRKTHDAFFLLFATAFGIDAAARFLLAFQQVSRDTEPLY